MRTARRKSKFAVQEDADPLSVVVNLFDVAMVFAVALMVAMVMHMNMTEVFTQEDFTIVKNPGKDNMEIIMKEGNNLKTEKLSMCLNNRKMMKIGMIIILWFCLTGGLVVAQEKRAYTLFDADGQETDYAHMMSVLGEQQVVFIGEIHNCPIAHWMEYEIVRDLYALHKDRLMIGAEMFERDDQLVLDEYLSGLITAERFTKEAKLWPNYPTDYKKIVEFAKTNRIPFVATNVPRRYAAMVSRGGFEALEQLSEEAKNYIAPLPLNYVRNEGVETYFRSMEMPGAKKEDTEKLAKAQALKDATMGWSIAQNIGSYFVHLNGSFHSANQAGIITYLNRYRPGLKIATVEVVRQEKTDKLDKDVMRKADFYICVPTDMTTTY